MRGRRQDEILVKYENFYTGKADKDRRSYEGARRLAGQPHRHSRS